MKSVNSCLAVLIFLLLAPLVRAQVFDTSSMNYQSNFTTLYAGGRNISSGFSTQVNVFFVEGREASSPEFTSEFNRFSIMNAPPEYIAIPDQSWEMNTNNTINLSKYFYDKDYDKLSFSSSEPENITVSIDNQTGTAILQPDADWEGTNYIVFTATDGMDYSRSNNVTLTVSYTPSPKPGPGPGPSLNPNFSVDMEVIRISILQGETVTHKIRVANIGDTPIHIDTEVKDVENFVYFINEEKFRLGVGEEKELTMMVTATEKDAPVAYFGKIVLRAGGIQRTIGVVIEVKEREALFDVSVFLPDEFKRVERGTNITADIILYNFGTLKPVDVYLTYGITDMEGNIVDSRQETFAVESQLYLNRSFFVPAYLDKGYYLFFARLDYENRTATGSDLFIVMVEEEFSMLQLLLAYWQVIAGSLIGVGGGYYIKRRAQRKARREQEIANVMAAQREAQLTRRREDYEREKERIRELENLLDKLEKEAWKELEQKYEKRARDREKEEKAWEELQRKYEKIKREREKQNKFDWITEEQWQRMEDRYRGNLKRKKERKG